MDLLELQAEVQIENRTKRKVNEELIESFVTIDSSKRDQYPSHVLDTTIINCPVDPISVTENSNYISVSVPEGSCIEQFDQIIIDNVQFSSVSFHGQVTIGASTLAWSVPSDGAFEELLSGFPMNSSYLVPMDISNFEILTLAYDDIIPPGALDNRLNVFVNRGNESTNFEVSSIGQYWPPVDSSVTASFTITNAHIGGIPIQELQSNLPIDSNHNNPSKVVYDVENNVITLQTSITALFTSSGGGNAIYIAEVLSESNGYQLPTSYYQHLDRTYANIKQIRLIASEFPCSIINVDGNTSLSYDGQSYPFMRKQTILPPKGCYSPDQLIDVVITLMNDNETTSIQQNVSRRRVFEKVVTNDIAIQCWVLASIPASAISINASINRAQITLQAHGLSNNDNIYIINPSSTSDIVDVLSFQAIVLQTGINTYNPDQFLIRLNSSLIDYINTLTFVNIKIPSKFRFYTSNILPILGIASPTTTTGFDTTHSSSQQCKLWPYSSFELRIRPDQPVDGVTPILLASDDLLGRIRLDSRKIGNGKVLIDKHTLTWALTFHPPLLSLSGLNVFLAWSDGTSPDFDYADHAFTIGISEIVQSNADN